MIAEPRRPPVRPRALSPGLLALLLLPAACAGAPTSTSTPTELHEEPAGSAQRAAIEAVLDDFHAAASEADGPRYFDHLADGAVFLGTDATERWTKEAFHDYAAARFATGTGWTYHPYDRHVFLGPGGRTAWFDERLSNARYGEVRGTGVLVRSGRVWRLSQYNLSFPVPNDLAPDLVERIRSMPRN